jgi:hypothetical protein
MFETNLFELVSKSGLLQDPNVTKFSQNKNNFNKKIANFFLAFQIGNLQ